MADQRSIEDRAAEVIADALIESHYHDYAGRMERAGTIVALLDNAGLLATDYDLSPVCVAVQCHLCLGCDCGCHRSPAPTAPPVLRTIPGGGTDA